MGNNMKNLFFFLSISFLIFSCSDEKKIIDLSFKSDLIVSQYIKGKMVITDTLVPDDINKITLDNVQSILVSNCLNEFSDNGVFYNIAQGFSCSNLVGRQKVNTEQHKEILDFRDHVCTQALYSCVG